MTKMLEWVVNVEAWKGVRARCPCGPFVVLLCWWGGLEILRFPCPGMACGPRA
jgi:hypothetical protein